MRNPPKTIVWYRNDLRVEDHAALLEASMAGEVLLLYIHPSKEEDWPIGSASKWWLHHSLLALKEQLQNYHAELIIRMGDPLKELLAVIKETGANAVYWNRRYCPSEIAVDTAIKAALTEKGIICKSFRGNVLFEPWTLLNKSGKPFQVFTPFWKACLSSGLPEKPLPTPKKMKAIHCKSLRVEELNLLPVIPWDHKFKIYWVPGSDGAREALQKFIKDGVGEYATSRDFPSKDGVSLLSPHLHFGEITPNMIWYTVVSQEKLPTTGTACFLKQLGWREFAHHLLYHFPNTPAQPLRKEFEKFPWKENLEALKAWKKGMTGYPIVDAGMRQLWKTGWMHNRMRMVVGSFLVKDLMISWLEGAKWFWDTLVDADLPNNTLGWQWIGGCGADAAPYFRVFNPVLQGEKFDHSGDFIRQWVPELSRVPDCWIHQPWNAPPMELALAGVVLGKDYPYPIVDHNKARDAALEAFKSIRGKGE